MQKKLFGKIRTVSGFKNQLLACSMSIFFILFLAGCGKDFRWNGAHNVQDAINTGGEQVSVTITCNRPGAIVYAPNGDTIGACPAKVLLIFDKWSCQSWGPPSMLNFHNGGDRVNDRYYLSGAVAAPGFNSKNFRLLIRSGRRTGKEEKNPTFRVDL